MVQQDEQAVPWHKRPDVHELLAAMLRFPFADYTAGIEAVRENVPFTDGHAMGLVSLAATINFKKGARWKDSPLRNRGVVLHVWLWHFLDGKSKELRPPPATTTQADTKFVQRAVKDVATPPAPHY